MYELNIGEIFGPWPKETYTRCDVKCQYFVSFAQDSFLATELSLGLAQAAQSYPVLLIYYVISLYK
jgi:hypothetical protein